MLNHTGPNWLKAWAQRLVKLRGKKRATVALARRIGVENEAPDRRGSGRGACRGGRSVDEAQELGDLQRVLAGLVAVDDLPP